MPRVKIDYVVSFSSEDPEHPANNLLNREVSKKKWLCKEGESSSSVVLQLAKAVKISAVHIGAYNAALVEVLAARSETSNDRFQVLVPSSVFISREESRRGAAERVRSFTSEQLHSAARDQRWDRLRIVCSQPYNKHCKYGLSFVHIEEPESSNTAVPPRLTLALDTLSDDEEFKPGQLFAKHLQKNNITQPSTTTVTSTNTGAQIRQATSQALKNIPESSTKLTKTPITKPSVKRDSPATEQRSDRTRETLMYTDDDEKPHARIDSLVQRHKDEQHRNDDKKQADKRNRNKLNESPHKAKDEHSRNKTNTNNKPQQVTSPDRSNNKNKERKDKPKSPPQASPSQHDTSNNDRPARDEPNKQVKKRRRSHSNQRETEKVRVPAHECLRDVVLVLSGYENPRRARVRQLALALGARVERDWGPTCTHLICAFPNTPKLRAVRSERGDSVPVTRAEWIEQCAAQGTKLPWRWYATEHKHRLEPNPELLRETPTPPPAATPSDHQSEGDTDEEIEKVVQEQKKRRLATTDDAKQPKPDTSPAPATYDGNTRQHPTTYDGNTRVHPTTCEQSPSEARVAHSGDSTDEESDVIGHVTPFGGSLANFFDGYTFAIDAELDEAERMKRYICAYGGLVLEMSEVMGGSEVDYVIVGRGSRVPAQGRPAAWLARCIADKQLLPV